jgi:transcriptional regulator with XRE-family HTH domain
MIVIRKRPFRSTGRGANDAPSVVTPAETKDLPSTAADDGAAADSAAVSGVSRTLAEKLEHLFQTVHPERDGPYSNDYVAREIEAKTGISMTGQFIWFLRNGKRNNPTVERLEALAQFFGVGLAYFDDDEYAARVDADLRLLSTMREAGATRMLTRAADLARLSDSSRDAIVTMIEQALRFEGLDPSTGAEVTDSNPS